MKIYQSISNKKNHRKKKITFFGFFVVLVLLLVINFANILLPKTIMQGIIAPFVPAQVALNEKIETIESFFTQKQNLQNKIIDLEARNKQLQNEKTLLVAFLEDSEIYREESLRFEGNAEVSKVLVRPPYTPFDSLSIVRNGDYEVGSDVFAQGVYIGTVTTVSGTVAQVTLFSQSNKKTIARIRGLDVELVGIGGGGLISTIPKDYDIATGTPVTTLLGDTMVLLGTVLERDVEENSSFSKLYISPAVALQSLQYVTVVTK